MLKVVRRAARDQHLFPDLDDVDQLGRVTVEIDHVAGFARGLRARVHGDADIGLGERGRVVRSVAGHRDEMAVRLFLTNAFKFLFGRGLGHEIVHASFGGDRRGGERIVAGDHHRLDSHFAQMGEALLDAAFDDVLQLDRRRVSPCPTRRRAEFRHDAKFHRRFSPPAAEKFHRRIRRIREPLRRHLCVCAWSVARRSREDRHRSYEFAR